MSTEHNDIANETKLHLVFALLVSWLYFEDCSPVSVAESTPKTKPNQTEP